MFLVLKITALSSLHSFGYSVVLPGYDMMLKSVHISRVYIKTNGFNVDQQTGSTILKEWTTPDS